MDQKKRADTILLLRNQRISAQLRLKEEYTDEKYRKQLEDAIRKLDIEIKGLEG